MLVLAGIGVIVAGFLLRFNPLLVVAASALVTGLAAGLDPLAIIAAFGKAYNDSRYVTVIYIVLPVIGLLERHGLQQRARDLIAKMRGATVGRLLLAYLVFRQLTSALGLTSIAGHAQTVRPLSHRWQRPPPTSWTPTATGKTTVCPQWPPRPTTSGCSLARTSSSPSARSC